jgi:hypothetical protein
MRSRLLKAGGSISLRSHMPDHHVTVTSWLSPLIGATWHPLPCRLPSLTVVPWAYLGVEGVQEQGPRLLPSSVSSSR